MKRDKCSTEASARSVEAGPHPVLLRTMYADALREVMADPRKAIAEHDPWLATLLGARLASAAGKR